MRARFVVVLMMLSAAAFAQLPRGLTPWWDGPIVRDLNLTPPQRQQIRSVVREYRPRLADARANVLRCEAALEDMFNQDRVDEARANQAIRDLAAARQSLTTTLAEMSLKLRMSLTPDQWRELQKRRQERPLGGRMRRGAQQYPTDQ